MTFRPAARQPVAHCGTVTLNSVSATETHWKSERDFMFDGEARIGGQGALRFYKLFKVLYWSKVSSPSFTVAYVWTPSPLFLSLPFSRASIFSYPWGSRRRKCIDVAWRCVAYRGVAKLGVAGQHRAVWRVQTRRGMVTRSIEYRIDVRSSLTQHSIL